MKSLSPLSRALTVLLVLLCVVTASVAEDRRARQDRLSLMTYNVEFMWDGEAPEEGNVSFEWKGRRAAALQRIQQIAKILKAANADIVHLVEVENALALALLNSQIPELGYEEIFVQGKDSSTGQDVAILTRIDPVESSRWDRKGISGNVSKSVTKNIRATFATADGFRFTVIGLHFLAYPDKKARMRERQAQAAAIADAAILSLASGPVFVMGDFNDYDGETLDAAGSKPITTVLSIVLALDTANPRDDLFNVASFVPQGRRFTSHWDKDGNGKVDAGEHTAIDHILVSASLRSDHVVTSILNDLDLENPSDHYPVLTEFRISQVVGPNAR